MGIRTSRDAAEFYRSFAAEDGSILGTSQKTYRTLPRYFAERKPVAIQVFDHHFANPVRSYVRWRLDHCAATLKVRVKAIHVIHVQIHVAFERRSLPLRQVSAPNLEVNPYARSFH